MRKILKITGALRLMYYFLITSYAGKKTTFSKYWLGTGIIYCILAKIKCKAVSVIYKCLVPVWLFFGMTEAMIIAGAHKKTDETADYVIILGAQVKGNRPSRSLLRRIRTGADFYFKHPDIMVIASGGQGENEAISEAQCICETLERMGVPSERIIKEDRSTSTRENLLFSKAIGGSEARYVLVSNSFHIFRAVVIAKSQGLKNCSGLAASSEPVLLLNYYVREFYALIFYVISNVLKQD